MEAENPLDKEVGKVLGIRCRCAWYHVSLLRQAVHYYLDSLIAVKPGQAYHKVHAYILPWGLQDWE